LKSYPQPGSFVHIRPTTDGTDPLLRRAFSIFDYDELNGTIDILFKIFGRGSLLLSKVKPGVILDVLGPLGNGFIEPTKETDLVLVGGGVGIPPVYLAAKDALRKGHPKEKVTFLCGFICDKESVMAERVKGLPITVRVSTDDGSLGFHGYVSQLLEQELDSNRLTSPLVCACGPEAMLKAVQSVVLRRNVPCFLSLESIMPCGVGTCLGCVVKAEGEDKYKRVCREGPVFDAREVEL